MRFRSISANYIIRAKIPTAEISNRIVGLNISNSLNLYVFNVDAARVRHTFYVLFRRKCFIASAQIILRK